MSKFKIKPKSGSARIAKKIKFEVADLRNENGLRIRIENATHSVPAIIEGKTEGYVDLKAGVDSFSGVVDLNIPEHSSHAAISVYAIIDAKQPNGSYAVSAMLTSVYNVTDKPKEEFKGEISITPEFIGPSERTSVLLNYEPNSRIVISINDKRFSILTDKNGRGSITVNASDLLTEKKSAVLQKFPVRVLLANNNYTIPLSTDCYIHVLPAKVAMFAELTNVDSCPPTFDDSPVQVQLSNPPQPFGIPTITGPVLEKRTAEVLTSLTTLTSVPDHSVAQTASGVSIHAFIGSGSGGFTAPQTIDPNLAKDPLALATQNSVNLNQIYLVDHPSSLNKAIVSAGHGTVEPGSGNITIEVSQGVYSLSSIGYLVGLLSAQFGFAYYPIVGLLPPDAYDDNYRLVLNANVEIDQYVNCVPFTMVSGADPYTTVTFNSPFVLPPITNQLGEISIPVKVSIATSQKKQYTNGIGYIYVIAEAMVGFASQLFYYGMSMDGNNTYGWVQLTFNGENKNPVTICDSAGNVHVAWESTRAGSSQIYYGILGPSANSYSNALFWSMLDKQAALVNGTTSFEVVDAGLFTELEGPQQIYTPLTCNQHQLNTIWIPSKGNHGVAEAINNTEVHFSGNPAIDQALVWTLLDIDNNNVTLDSFFKERSFAIQFTIRDKQHRKVLSDEDIQNEYQNWLLSYVPVSSKSLTNANVYTKSLNTFVIGMENRYFDRFIPILGSYRKDDLKSLFADCVTEDDSSFTAILTGCNATVKHFMIGLMPEKVRWKATNNQTYSEFCSAHGLNPLHSQNDYLQDEEVVTYTGRYKLIVIMSGNNQYASNGGGPDFTVTRQIGNPFTLGPDDGYFQVIQHYRKMFREDVAHWFNANPADENFDLARYISSLMIVQGHLPPDYHVPTLPNKVPPVDPPVPSVCQYTFTASLNWSTNADFDLYTSTSAGTVYYGDFSVGGLSLNWNAHPACAADGKLPNGDVSSSAVPPEVITGSFNEPKTFHTWYNQATNCTTEQAPDSVTITVKNTGLGDIVVNNTTITPGNSWTTSVVANAGYATGPVPSYADGTSVVVTCGDNTPPVYQPCGDVSWTVDRHGEPYFFPTGSEGGTPNGPYLTESDDYFIDFSNPDISQLVFTADSELDDILIMMPAGSSVVQTGGNGYEVPVSFTIPRNCIIFTQNYGFFCNSEIPGVWGASSQKTITDGVNTAVIPLGDNTNTGHGDYRLFNQAAFNANPDPVFPTPTANFTIANFVTGVSRSVLEANGFIDSNNQLSFKFAHIVCGVGNAFVDGLTCGYSNSTPPPMMLDRNEGVSEQLTESLVIPPSPSPQLLTWKPIFAESILVDFCPNQSFGFNLAFGFPGTGQFISNEPQPYETSVFDYGHVDLIIKDITVGFPHFNSNKDFIDMPLDAYNPDNMQVVSAVNACNSESFEDTYGWLTMGLDQIDFPELIVTLEGANQNPSIALGPVCDDVHLAWQSNRNDFWDIYYSVSNPTTMPFRFDTRITDTQTHSLMPKVAVDASGSRVIAWHENREDNQYQIYAAKGVGNGFCPCNVPPKVNCVVDFNFCFFPCANYTSVNPCLGEETIAG